MAFDLLSAVLGALAGAAAALAATRAVGRPDTGAGETAAHGASCEVCMEPFDSVEDARDHVIDEHAAISARNWRDVVRGADA